MATNDRLLTKKGPAQGEVVLIDLTNEDLEITLTGPAHQRELLMNLEYKPPERSRPLLRVSSSPRKPVPAPKGLCPSASIPLKPEIPVRDTLMAAKRPSGDDSHRKQLRGNTRAGQAFSQHGVRDIHPSFRTKPMNTWKANPIKAPSTHPAKTTRKASNRRSTNARPRDKFAPWPKRWTDAGPEDILLFQLKASGLSHRDTAAQWNKTTGHSYSDAGLKHRWWMVHKFIGMPPQHLLDMDIRAHWQSESSKAGERNGDLGSSGAAESDSDCWIGPAALWSSWGFPGYEEGEREGSGSDLVELRV